jgi:putative membrane protein
MRTGMASLAVAVGLRAVFGAFEPTWAAKAVASIFVLTAIFIFWAAQDSACNTLTRLSENEATAQPVRRMRLLSMIFSAGSIAVGAILWTL